MCAMGLYQFSSDQSKASLSTFFAPSFLSTEAATRGQGPAPNQINADRAIARETGRDRSMESAIADSNCKKPSLIGSKGRMTSSSFRLRSSSLNALRLRRVFDLFDSNHDEIITVDELSQALLRLGLQADLAELSSMVQPQIRPGKTGLEFQDFEILHRSLNDTFFGLEHQGEDDDDDDEKEKSLEESDLNEAFKVFDEDGDGYISASELQAVLGKLGFAEGKEIDGCKQMILKVDSNHDGRVDFHEFKVMMRNTILVNSSSSSS